LPALKAAGILAIQSALLPSVALEEVETLVLDSRMNPLRESI
ncbi:EAL domain-containing protein, partial [Salmonella enterica subsp. enterica]|nr:EAL domain-containing protein [Salmonella enterica subsp. enterica]